MCGVSLWFYGYYTTHIVIIFNLKGNHNIAGPIMAAVNIVTTFNLKRNHNEFKKISTLSEIITTFNFKGNHNTS